MEKENEDSPQPQQQVLLDGAGQEGVAVPTLQLLEAALVLVRTRGVEYYDLQQLTLLAVDPAVSLLSSLSWALQTVVQVLAFLLLAVL